MDKEKEKIIVKKPETTKERAIRLGIIPKPKKKKEDANTKKE